MSIGDLTSDECVVAWDEVEELSTRASHATDKQKEKNSDSLETLLQGQKILRLKTSWYYSHANSPKPQDRLCKSKIANNSDYCHYWVRGRCTTSMRVTRRQHAALWTGCFDVAPCGACRPWIFFINGVVRFLKLNGSGMEKEERWLETPLQGEDESTRSSPP